MLNVPTMLTLFRLALLPFIILLFFIPAGWAAWTCLVLYVIGAVTDWLDGWIARKWNLVSELGTFLDPISDKIFVVTVLLMLVAVDRITGIWVIAVIIILMREFVVAGLREFLGPKGVKLPVTKLAKWKTATQMTAIPVLIVAPFVPYAIVPGLALLTAAAVLTVMTGWHYLQSSFAHMKG